jgi:hypothetical protein
MSRVGCSATCIPAPEKPGRVSALEDVRLEMVTFADRRRYDDVPVTPALDSVLMMILMGLVEALCDEFAWFDWKAEKSWLSI